MLKTKPEGKRILPFNNKVGDLVSNWQSRGIRPLPPPPPKGRDFHILERFSRHGGRYLAFFKKKTNSKRQLRTFGVLEGLWF